jgi:nucleoside-diphosphate-sugar epimerase
MNSSFQSRILVTGGAGFVGSCLAQGLANNPDNLVFIVDNLLTGSENKLPISPYNNVRFILYFCTFVSNLVQQLTFACQQSSIASSFR